MRFVAQGRSRWAALLLLAPLALAAACQSASGATATSGGAAAVAGAGGGSQASAAAAAITVTPGNGTSDVDPSTPASVSVSGGKLTSVTLTDKDGDAVSGTLSTDGTTWTGGTMSVSTSYTLTAAATTASGQPLTKKVSFTTLTPTSTVKIASITPSSGSTVGVGEPVSLQFHTPITTAAGRAAVERNLQVTTTPAVTGSWHWFGDDRVDWRPQSYWAPGTKVSVHADLDGVKVAKGVYGVSDKDFSFTIGRSLIATENVDTHHMTVVKDGKTIADYPTSAGQPGLDTWNGVMVVMEKDPDVEMNSETVGLGDAYDIPDVKWAVRLTSSGTFVHAAPWSVGEQGVANTSHGCIGMSTANANAFFDMVIPGDVVQVVNSKDTVAADNGFGDWNLSWSQWTAGSALAGGQ